MGRLFEDGLSRRWSGLAAAAVLMVLAFPAVCPADLHGGTEQGSPAGPAATVESPQRYCPPLWSAGPFVLLLLCIAILPLIPACGRFWHRNRNKLLVALTLSAPVLLYYCFVHPPMMVREDGQASNLPDGLPLLGHVLAGAVLEEYFPFIVLLFGLYAISGGIRLRGDLPAHPITNTLFLAAGGVMASFVGTTGAAMLLIRPLLLINGQRMHVRHTVLFFIFVVCNVGGCLLPIGDPPLFLGYLKGVPFLWTLRLAAPWALCTAILLVIYFLWDSLAYRREKPEDIMLDETAVEPLGLQGKINLLYLLGVVLSAALLIPGERFLLYKPFVVPKYLREGAMLALAGLSLATTPAGLRKANQFTFAAIGEVAALFIGIFITMQAPIEILNVRGPGLGLNEPWQFFWASGGLSSFLDNAPTYVVFFETANSLTHGPGEGILNLLSGHYIRVDLLVAVSLGSVFMGANTYIGNGPNFMVKAIAEERGIRMPSFFGYMLYSIGILIPVFVLITIIVFVLRWI